MMAQVYIPDRLTMSTEAQACFLHLFGDPFLTGERIDIMERKVSDPQARCNGWMTRRPGDLLKFVRFGVDAPRDRLATVAVVQIKVEDDGSGYTVVAMSVGDGDVHVVYHAESAWHGLRTMMTWWTYADMEPVVEAGKYSI